MLKYQFKNAVSVRARAFASTGPRCCTVAREAVTARGSRGSPLRHHHPARDPLRRLDQCRVCAQRLDTVRTGGAGFDQRRTSTVLPPSSAVSQCACCTASMRHLLPRAREEGIDAPQRAHSSVRALREHVPRHGEQRGANSDVAAECKVVASRTAMVHDYGDAQLCEQHS